MSDVLADIFGVDRPVIGMVHLPPLHGSPGYRGDSVEDVLESALLDALALKEGGVDGVQVENMGDKPFMKPGLIGYEAVSTVALVAREVRKAVGLPTGVFILANGVGESIAAAVAAGVRWVRANMYILAYVADEGFVEACSPKAERLKSFLGGGVGVFADIYVKHGSHYIVSDVSLEYQAERVAELGADAVVVSGLRTGGETPVDRLAAVKRAVDKPVLVGSGLTPANAEKLMRYADGAIVGTYFKRDGVLSNPVDVERVRRLVEAVKRLRR